MAKHSKASSQPSLPHSTRSRWRLPLIVLGLAGVAVVSAATGALLAVSLASTPLLQSRLSPQEAGVFAQDDLAKGQALRLPQLARPVNILVLGIKVLSSDLENPPEEVQDLGYHALVNSFEGLSDTMLLIRFDPDADDLTVLSIPRDTRGYVEDVGVTKLNEANRIGGPALSATAVSELLNDTRIDRYVRINVQGVEKLIDALGGVDVYVPKDMKYTDESQHLYIDLKEGEQTLNGDEAMQFLRYRYDETGDIGRVQRQQTLMRAIQEQTLSPTTLTRIPQIFSVIQSHVDTNLSVEELLALVGFASQMERSDVQMVMLPGDFSTPGQYRLSYWIPQERAVSEMVARYFRHSSSEVGDRRSSNALRVAIQDSTDNSEAVRRIVRRLNEAGYGNVYIAQDWSEPLLETRIIAQGGDVESAAVIQSVLGVGEVRVESTGVLQTDVTVQIGQDWLSQTASSQDSNTL
ncbi:MAG: LCP family protein [Leptolyngbyaceae bacterium]|nr:LCP family protein [Leptolyngbyaceae bacterium]